MPLWVKICGVTVASDASAAVDCGADAIGVNFFPRSKRFCSLAQAVEVIRAVPSGFPVYGVFVDASRDYIERMVRDSGINALQFHGGESEEIVSSWDLPVIRALPTVSREAARQALCGSGSYRVLLDSAAGGGSGILIEESVLEGLDLASAILAGGLTADNVADIVARFAPYGVDCAGGVERSPGLKDVRLMRKFIDNAR